MSALRLEVEAHIVSASATAVQNLTKCVQLAGVKIDELVVERARLGRGRADRDREGAGRRGRGHRRGHDRPRPVRGRLAVPHGRPAGRRQQRDQRRRDRRQDDAPGRRGAQGPPRHLRPARPRPTRRSASRSSARTPAARSAARSCAGSSRPGCARRSSCSATEMTRSGHGMLPAGIILTGGGAQLAGTAELGREVLQMPVRVAGPSGIGGLIDTIQDPAYSTCVGPAPLGRQRASAADEPHALRVGARRRRPRPPPRRDPLDLPVAPVPPCARSSSRSGPGRDRGFTDLHPGLCAVRRRRGRGRRRAALGVRAPRDRRASWSSSSAPGPTGRRQGARPAPAARRPLAPPPRFARATAPTTCCRCSRRRRSRSRSSPAA